MKSGCNSREEVETACLTSIEGIIPAINRIAIFPNPGDGFFRIDGADETIKKGTDIKKAAFPSRFFYVC